MINFPKIPLDINVFAYMRRSTTKLEQADSLLQQAEGIQFICGVLGISTERIRFFTESKSGYENRTRGEWTKMTTEIEKLKSPCILMCRDTSRLSRNPKDNLWITDHLYGDNGHKKVLDKIFFLEGLDLQCWDCTTDKEKVVDELHSNYKNSLVTKKKSNTGILLKLEAKEFPYHPPCGLDRVLKGTDTKYQKSLHKSLKTVLKQNEKMPYIRRAFQMKAEGKTAKEISQYLRKNGSIRIAPKKIVETIISNTVYLGEYTESSTREPFKGLHFFEGIPPIERTLWDRANATIGKRGSGIGEGQADHLFIGKIRTEEGGSFQLYKATGQHNSGVYYNYKGTRKAPSGAIKNIYISELNILRQLVPELSGIAENIETLVSDAEKLIVSESMIQPLKEEIRRLPNMGDISEKELDENVRKLIAYFDSYNDEKVAGSSTTFDFSEGDMLEFFEGKKRKKKRKADIIAELGLTSKEIFQIQDDRFGQTTSLQEYLSRKIEFRNYLIYCALQNSEYFKNLQQELKMQEEVVRQLKEEEKKKQEEISKIEETAFKLGYSKDFADKQKENESRQLYGIQEQIKLLEGNSNLQGLIQKIPIILSKIVELTTKTITYEETSGIREDIKHILEVIAVELTITNKKELIVKLFAGLEDLVKPKKGNWSHRRELNP